MAQAQQETRGRTRDPVGDTFGIGEMGEDMGNVPIPHGQGGMPSILPGRQGDTSINIAGAIVTAQRVAVHRDVAKVRAELAALASMAGKQWVYGWEVNDRANNRKVWVEGPTIKLANDLARTWGNCRVDVVVEDQGSQWMFYGRFTDYETGYQLVRGFQQRKGQNTGMKDGGRATDMIFQLGQSKAIRNVVVNALQTLATYCVEEAKGSILGDIEKNPDKFRAALVKFLARLGVDVKRVEKVYGRNVANWTVPDMARINTEATSIDDGMMNAEDVWPLVEDSAGDEQDKQTVVPQGGATTSSSAPLSPSLQTGGTAPEAVTTGDAEPQLEDGERVIVLEGGVPLGKLPAGVDLKVGVPYEFEFGAATVLEYTTKQVVVRRPSPKVDAQPAEASKTAKSADKKTPKAPAKSNLFGGD